MTDSFTTPLERVVGFPVAEKTYDLLNIQEQLILDLLIQQWNLQDIAIEVGIKPRDMPKRLRIIRMKLADSELHFALEVKRFHREQRSIVVDETDFSEGYTTQDLLA